MNRRTLGLAALLLVLVAAGAYAKKQKQTKAADEQKRALHALDRLTFGPRPGDVDAVTAMGVDKWIELQLHPERIDNAALQSHLAPYRTLTMSTREMVMAFPPNPVAKAVMDGKLPMPSDPYRRAIYVAAIDRVEVKDQKKNEQQQPPQAEMPTASAAPDNGMKPPDASASALATSAATLANSNAQPPDVQPVDVQPATVKPTDLAQKQGARKQAHLAVDDLILLPPAARMQRILVLPVAEQRDLLQGIPYPKRLALLSGLSPEQRETVIALNHPEAVIDSELQAGKLLRAVYSDRQLEEVLTDFWFNHFNVFIGKGADRYLVTAYERDVIRPHVLGKFKDMLVATAQSPAMLFYLDNWQSEGPDSDAALGKPAQANNPHPFAPRRPGALYPPPSQRPQQQPRPAAQNQNQQKRSSGLNENYARELMELHTLGVNGGYTQHDVTEVARVFTGWTLDQPQQGGGFIFRPRLHEPGDKLVLGHHIKQGGENEGIEVLTLLSRQPATARFISTELAQRFVADTPPPTLIDAMSKTFLKTDGDLREVMRTMFDSPEFWAPEAYRARVKTPFEFVVSSLRATQSDVTEPQALIYVLNKMGQPLYGSQPPTGYSTKSDVWVNSAALLDRMNFGLALATNKLQGTNFNLAQLMNATPAPAASATAVSASTLTTSSLGDADPYQVQLKLEQLLLAGDISKQTHDAIEQQIVGPQLSADTQTRNQPNVNVIAGLLLGSPEFQRK